MDFDLKSLKEVGGIFKFATGVLGKSAIVLGILLVAAIVAVWRLHSDIAIFGTLVLVALIFFLWFYQVIKFAGKHPDIALLEGAEWSGFQRFQAEAKGYFPKPSERHASSAPSSGALPPGAESSLAAGIAANVHEEPRQ